MDASKCPFCGSTDTWFDGGETDDAGGTVYEHLHCDGCGEDFTNIYTLFNQIPRFTHGKCESC